MIIKSNIRGGYRAAADYMKEIGKNEKTRLVELSDPSAKNLDDAFHNMWVVAGGTRCTKPLHHISINPMKDERLTDKQVLAIVERLEEKYGYKMFHHQRVIVEHVKDGRQHFHVIWNRVSLMNGRPVWPGQHWNKSKQAAREMEKELGLKRPVPKRTTKGRAASKRSRPMPQKSVRQPQSKYDPIKPTSLPSIRIRRPTPTPIREEPTSHPAPILPGQKRKGWPEAAVLDWEVWGNRNPRRFFALWPELAP